MPDERHASELRQQVRRLTAERATVERELRLRYVAKDRLPGGRQAVEAWRAFRARLRRWRELSGRLETLWRQLAEAQAQSPEDLPS